jgi:hypothetical protein
MVFGPARVKRRSSADGSLVRGGPGVIKWLAVSWEDASFAVIAALALLSASFVSYPPVSVEFVSNAGVEIGAATPSLGPIMVSIEDDDPEIQEEHLELCALPGVRLVWPLCPTLSQIMPPQSVSLPALTPIQHPLRC